MPTTETNEKTLNVSTDYKEIDFDDIRKVDVITPEKVVCSHPYSSPISKDTRYVNKATYNVPMQTSISAKTSIWIIDSTYIQNNKLGGTLYILVTYDKEGCTHIRDSSGMYQQVIAIPVDSLAGTMSTINTREGPRNSYSAPVVAPNIAIEQALPLINPVTRVWLEAKETFPISQTTFNQYDTCTEPEVHPGWLGEEPHYTYTQFSEVSSLQVMLSSLSAHRIQPRFSSFNWHKIAELAHPNKKTVGLRVMTALPPSVTGTGTYSVVEYYYYDKQLIEVYSRILSSRGEEISGVRAQVNTPKRVHVKRLNTYFDNQSIRIVGNHEHYASLSCIFKQVDMTALSQVPIGRNIFDKSEVTT